ncbi:MAG TPA: hypothetical protein ENK23_04550 [Sorangium sp.]|nr:hypothetical protein [Sorangium sp.]
MTRPLPHTHGSARRLALALGASAALWVGAALAHPTHGSNDEHHHHQHGAATHHHGHDGDETDTPATTGPSAAERKLRVAQILKRTEQRLARMEEIRKDRRQALRRRLFKRLEGKPLNASMKDELRVHAQRMARLQRIRYVAAKQGDYDTIQTVDVLIGKENSRHEAWWRAIRRAAVRAVMANKNAQHGATAPSANKSAPPTTGQQP